MKTNLLFSAIILTGFCACQFGQQKTISSDSTDRLRTPQSEALIQPLVDRSLAIAVSTELNSENCSAQLNPLLDELEKLNPVILKLNFTASADLERQKTLSTQWLKDLFKTRNLMRARISELVKNQTQTACLKSIRRYLVVIRFFEETLIEAMLEAKLYPEQDADDKETAFRTGFPATLVNEKFEKLEFKSGDVLLDRGDSALSAQIARIGDTEHVYSHAMIVGEDAHGKLYVVETTVQDIVGIEPLQKYWDENADARMAVFRHPDEKLARKAGRFIYDYVSSKRGQIRYDFHMNDQNADEMFCSEVVQFAYRKASDNQMIVPMFKTDISHFNKMERKNWVRKMQIPYDHIFSPSDIDVDPRFEQVAEYRYIPDLRDRRIDDAVMSSMYSWMLQKDYSFAIDLGDQIMSNLGVIKARFFNSKDIPENMPKGTIQSALQFDRVFLKIRESLEKKEEAYFHRHGYSMSFQMMLAENERFRQEDCQLYQNSKLISPSDSTVVESNSFLHYSLTSRKACP